MIYIYEQLNKFKLEDYKRYFVLLTDERQKKVQRFYFQNDKEQGMLAYLLLCFGLYHEYKILEKPVFTYEDTNKPKLKKYSSIFFNLSHCIKGICCGISNAPVGVDIQEYIEKNDGIAQLVCNRNEIEDLEKNNDFIERFTQIWALKECYGKYLAKGILYDLKEQDFSNIKSGGWTTLDKCMIYLNQSENYVIAVCSKLELDAYIVTYDELKSFCELALQIW